MTILETGQWKVRDLVLGPGTEYRIASNSPFFTLAIRADQSHTRAFGHGEMVGSEWANARVVPIRIFIDTTEHTELSWVDAIDQLAAAFQPVGSTGEIVELYRNISGREFVYFGRPRLIEPDEDLAAGGYGWVQCAFEAADPRRYSAELTTVSTGLTEYVGGLSTSFTTPFSIVTVLSSGLLQLNNTGTADSGLEVRVDGPLSGNQLVLQRPDGSVQSLSVNLDLMAGEFLLIDSVKKTALLNGVSTADFRGSSQWGWDTHPLPPGVTSFRFMGSDDTGTAQATVTYRSASW